MALDFTLGDSHEELRRRCAERFAPLSSYRPEILAGYGEEGYYPDEVWAALAETGSLGALIPKAHGGTALGVLGMSIALEELAAVDVANTLPILTGLATLCVAQHGSAELKERILPAVAKGGCRMCFAATEPAAGFNVFRTTTAARRDGDEYRIDGEKIYISGADVADYMLVVTRTTSLEECAERGVGKTFGLSLFLVDARSAGLSKQRLDTRGEGVMRQYGLRFDGVRVSAKNLLGDVDAGVLALFACFNPERVLMASLVVGMSRYCLTIACEHARNRRVFGDTPIGSYQAIQHPLAQVRLREESLRLLIQKAAWAFDGGRDALEVALFANAAKVLGAELAREAVDASIETLGGRGFSDEHGLLRLWQAARLFKTSPISDALALNFVAEHHLDLPRST